MSFERAKRELALQVERREKAKQENYNAMRALVEENEPLVRKIGNKHWGIFESKVEGFTVDWDNHVVFFLLREKDGTQCKGNMEFWQVLSIKRDFDNELKYSTEHRLRAEACATS